MHNTGAHGCSLPAEHCCASERAACMQPPRPPQGLLCLAVLGTCARAGNTGAGSNRAAAPGRPCLPSHNVLRASSLSPLPPGPLLHLAALQQCKLFPGPQNTLTVANTAQYLHASAHKGCQQGGMHGRPEHVAVHLQSYTNRISFASTCKHLARQGACNLHPYVRIVLPGVNQLNQNHAP